VPYALGLPLPPSASLLCDHQPRAARGRGPINITPYSALPSGRVRRSEPPWPNYSHKSSPFIYRQRFHGGPAPPVPPALAAGRRRLLVRTTGCVLAACTGAAATTRTPIRLRSISKREEGNTIQMRFIRTHFWRNARPGRPRTLVRPPFRVECPGGRALGSCLSLLFFLFLGGTSPSPRRGPVSWRHY
jgi:hypothetical protein